MQSDKTKLRKFPVTPPAGIGIAIAFYAFIAIGMAESGLGVLLPSIIQIYSLSPATVTYLFISQVAGYVIAAFSSSIISNWLGLAPMLLVAAIALTTALATYAMASAWFVMVVVGTLFGLSIGLIDAGINTYIVSDGREAKWIGLLHAFYGIGALLGPTIATTLLVLRLEWRQIYLVFSAIVALLVIAVTGIVITGYQPMMKKTATKSNAWADIRLALRMPIVILTGLFLLLNVGIEAALGNWAYTVQHLIRKFPAATAGYSVSAFWLGFTTGRLILGVLINKLGANRLINISLATLVFGLASWWLLPRQWLSLPLIGFAIAAMFPTTIWLMPQRVPSAIVPAAIGFVSSVASLGAAIIPTTIGWIANRAGLESIPVLILVLAIALIVLHRCLAQYDVKDSTYN